MIRNVRDMPWQENELGATAEFDGGVERFAELGVNLTALQPGQSMTMYHRENAQEGFLVLRGECLLVIDGEERPLRQWDYVHVPAGTAHAVVGAGDGLSLVLAVGNRIRDELEILYVREEAALRHDAGVEADAPHPREAYARFTRPAPQVEFREEFLTG